MGLDPLNQHNCMFCQCSYYDIGQGYVCKHFGTLTAEEYIQVNDCEAFLTRYLTDYGRRYDLERELKKKKKN